MSLINRIDEDRKTALRNGRLLEKNLLSTLYSEAYYIGKNKRNGLPTDDEVVATLKKFKKNAEELLSHQTPYTDPHANTLEEIRILDRYIPTMYSIEKLSEIIDSYGDQPIGFIMAQLKANHAGMYDGKMAAQIIKEKRNED